MKSALTALCAGLVFATQSTGLAHAQDGPIPAILAEALANAAVPSDETDWRFTVVFNGEGEELVAGFDGTRAADARWTLVSPPRAEMTELLDEVWNDLTDTGEDGDTGNLFFDPNDADLLWDTASLSAESGTGFVYTFQPDPAEADEEDAAFLDHIRGELTIDADRPVVTQMRLYAPESFKPHFAVRVQEFEVVQHYTRIDGIPAPVLTRLSQTVRGSAMMQSFSESFEIEFTDIEYLGR